MPAVHPYGFRLVRRLLDAVNRGNETPRCRCERQRFDMTEAKLRLAEFLITQARVRHTASTFSESLMTSRASLTAFQCAAC